MPNWCQNRLLVIGSESEVQRFLADNKSKESELDFGRAVPLLDENDWYNWCIEHWGTKWNAAEVKFGDPAIIWWQENDKTAELYQFDTAWGPPGAWFTTMCKEWPELELRLYYAELGGDFSGSIIWSEGQTTESGSLSLNELLSLDFGCYF